MKYIKLSLQYMYHNIWYLMIFALVPAILLGLLTNPASIANFLTSFKSLESFRSIFGSISELNWKSVLVSIAVIPVILIFVSAMCGVVSKHMRRGVLSFDKFFRRVNNNILHALVIGLALLIGLQLIALFFSSFATLWVKIFGNGRVALTLSLLTLFVLWLIFISTVSLCVIWMPTMSITGLNPAKALAESFRNVRGNFLKLFLAVSFPLIPYFAITIPFSYFVIPGRQIIYIIVYLLYIPYYVTLMYVAYCEINDIDREDLRIVRFKKTGNVDNDTEGDDYDA